MVLCLTDRQRKIISGSVQRDYRFAFAVNKHNVSKNSTQQIWKIYTLDWITPFRPSLYHAPVKIAVPADAVSCAVYFGGGARLRPRLVGLQLFSSSHNIEYGRSCNSVNTKRADH